MSLATDSRQVLLVLTENAIDLAGQVAASTSGTPEAKRAQLLADIPAVVGYYSDGSAALAADFYDEQRELAGVTDRFVSEAVVADRTVKLRRAVAWSAEPWFEDLDVTTESRLAEVVQLEVARAYRDTILANRRQDAQSVGWRRVTSGGCKLCRMLADRGAVYKESSARFAAHPSCHCTAEPVFLGGDTGPEASVLQYVASRRSRTPAQREALNSYLSSFY